MSKKQTKHQLSRQHLTGETSAPLLGYRSCCYELNGSQKKLHAYIPKLASGNLISIVADNTVSQLESSVYTAETFPATVLSHLESSV